MRYPEMLLLAACCAAAPSARAFGGTPSPTPSASKRPSQPARSDPDEYEEGQGGILYGKGWAFLIAAPKGWIMDEQGNGGQANVTFYR